MTSQTPTIIAAASLAEGQTLYTHGIVDRVTSIEQHDDGTATAKFYDGRTVRGGFFALVADAPNGPVYLTAARA